jgi:hypothetical protein
MNLVEGDLVTDLHLDGLNFSNREINEMISIFQRYDATDKVYVISLVDNGLDEDAINLILQLIFLLPYLKFFDLRRNSFGEGGIKTIEDKLREMEGVTGVVRTQDQVLNVHSGNQVRMTVDLSEQMPKNQVREVDFTVQSELCHDNADPFLATDGGKSDHPWTRSGQNFMRSPPQAVPDPSTVDLSATSQGPQAPQPTVAPAVGGPPVGLGGPGNLSALNKKDRRVSDAKASGRDRVPAPANRKQIRKKAAPPPPLAEYAPNERVVDKWQAGGSRAALHHRPSSSAERRMNSTSSQRESSQRRENSVRRSSSEHPLTQASCGIDRSCSMPALSRPAATGASRRPPRR